MRMPRRDAAEKAARIRLRPVLMTTLATLFGMVPLIFAGGPGAESRFAIGFVLGAGMLVGTVFTLFVVPALYCVMARQRHGDTTHVSPHFGGTGEGRR
jgi:multidrug efflux pump